MRVLPSHGCTSGFTLVEVLVALLIVAFGMGAVLTALTSSADNATHMREKTFAEWVGLNQLALARLQGTIPPTGATEGDVDFAANRWHWQQTVENIEVPGIRRLTIRVRAADPTSGPSSGTKPTAAKTSWIATVIGFRGDAVQSPLDELSNWDASASGSGDPGDPNLGNPSPGSPSPGSPSPGNSGPGDPSGPGN
jgi:general secretion pathway protein I